jgi:PIN domain nuclease of toxin-antitoxin system
LNPRYLLDTHILVRWLAEPKRLSREQIRVLRDAAHRRELIAISAMSLLEIAIVFGGESARSLVYAQTIFDAISSNPAIEIIPLSFEIASEVAAIGKTLRDPADRAIVATARVGRLKLITSDERIVASGLVGVIT